MHSVTLLRSKQKTWILFDSHIPGVEGGPHKEMVTVEMGTFVLQDGDGRPHEDDSDVMKMWIRVVHPERGRCRAVEDHWEVWGEGIPQT